jgi:hypothetical protein
MNNPAPEVSRLLENTPAAERLAAAPYLRYG